MLSGREMKCGGGTGTKTGLVPPAPPLFPDEKWRGGRFEHLPEVTWLGTDGGQQDVLIALGWVYFPNRSADSAVSIKTATTFVFLKNGWGIVVYTKYSGGRGR